ncbi:MAG: MCE family protein [Desulfobacterales bacterium]|nr:MCE family protein [Desulfobacterales bacterium]
MITQTQKARLGIFVFFAVTVLVGTLVALTGTHFTQNRDQYSIRLATSVSGLEIGSTVKYNGVQVGRIESIQVDPESVSTTLLTISVEHNTPIKQDTRAVSTSLGITGLKYIELIKSTDASPKLSPGGEIPEEISFVDTLTGKATSIALKTEQILNNLLVLTREENSIKLVSLFDRMDRILSETEAIMTSSRPSIVQLVQNLTQASSAMQEELKTISAMLTENRPVLYKTLEAAQGLITGLKEERETLSVILKKTDQLISDASELVHDPSLKTIVADTQQMIKTLNLTIARNQTNLAATLDYLNQASENLKNFSRIIQENPSSLFLGVHEED